MFDAILYMYLKFNFVILHVYQLGVMYVVYVLLIKQPVPKKS